MTGLKRPYYPSFAPPNLFTTLIPPTPSSPIIPTTPTALIRNSPFSTLWDRINPKDLPHSPPKKLFHICLVSANDRIWDIGHKAPSPLHHIPTNWALHPQWLHHFTVAAPVLQAPHPPVLSQCLATHLRMWMPTDASQKSLKHTGHENLSGLPHHGHLLQAVEVKIIHPYQVRLLAVRTKV